MSCGIGTLRLAFRGDAGGDAALGESSAKPVRIITLVTEQGLGRGQSIDHQGSALVVAHLPLAEQHDERAALAIADGMQLQFRPPLVPPIRRGTSPF